MKEVARIELETSIREGLEKVETVLANSHCPHSGLSVAAGLVLASGEIVLGINYESASYGLTLCAERTALAKAQSDGTILEATSLILAANCEASDPSHPPLTPCGACRQWLAELSERLGRDFPVYSFWKGGSTGLHTTAQELLPKPFL